MVIDIRDLGDGVTYRHRLRAIPRVGEYIVGPKGLLRVERVVWPMNPFSDVAAHLDCRVSNIDQ